MKTRSDNSALVTQHLLCTIGSFDQKHLPRAAHYGAGAPTAEMDSATGAGMADCATPLNGKSSSA